MNELLSFEPLALGAVTEPTASNAHAASPITIDREAFVAFSYGRERRLTPSEFRLLEALLKHPGRTFSRRELIDVLYPMGRMVVRKVIDFHMANLRRKLEPNPAEPRHLVTMRGFGYRFQV